MYRAIPHLSPIGLSVIHQADEKHVECYIPTLDILIRTCSWWISHQTTIDPDHTAGASFQFQHMSFLYYQQHYRRRSQEWSGGTRVTEKMGHTQF